MKKLTFDSVQVGDELPPISRSVTQETFWKYAVASFDYNPVHCDPAWVETAQPFGIPHTVAHGMMTMSFMGTMLSDWVYAAGGWIDDMDTKFVKPVTAGSTVTCSGVVIELHPIGKGKNFVVVDMKAVNQEGATLAVGKAKVTLP